MLQTSADSPTTRQPPQVVSELVREKSHRSIPSLDGLRAVSVIAVIVSHFNGYSTLAKTGLQHNLMTLLGSAGLGVSTFFVISGFLITTLLLQEKENTGTVRLKRFFFRRSLRIFPPFYVYLVVATMIAWLEHRPIPGWLLLAAAGYVMDYVPDSWVHSMSLWQVGHSWSLAVEEQFYLFWPVLVLIGTRRKIVQWCVYTLAVVPVLRLATLWFMPVYAVGRQWASLFHTTVDLLIFGALLAVLMRRKGFATWVQRLFHPVLLGAAAVFLPLSVLLRSHTPAWVDALFLVTFTGASISLLLLWVVLRPETLVGRFLNWAPVRHIGLISYSLYLWQQMFVGPQWVPSRPVNLVLILVVAELSYWFVERPSLRLRAWTERRWFQQTARPV